MQSSGIFIQMINLTMMVKARNESTQIETKRNGTTKQTKQECGWLPSSTRSTSGRTATATVSSRSTSRPIRGGPSGLAATRGWSRRACAPHLPARHSRPPLVAWPLILPRPQADVRAGADRRGQVPHAGGRRGALRRPVGLHPPGAHRRERTPCRQHAHRTRAQN